MYKKIVKLILGLYILPIFRVKLFRKFALKRMHIDSLQRCVDIVGNRLGDNACVFDIGAYMGFPGDTTPFFANKFSKNTIYAFEPYYENFKILTENMKKYKNVKTYNLALSDEEKSGILYITSATSSSSLLEVNSQEIDRLERFKEIKKLKEEEIYISTVDIFSKENNINEIGIMKIDTQGTELSILKGAEKTLKRTCLIILECNNHDSYSNSSKYYLVDEYLRSHNFQLYDMVASIYVKGRIYEWDSIYVNQDYFNIINTNTSNDEILPY